MIWICNECGEIFDEKEIEWKKEDDELKYSVELGSCPFCESFDIEELEEE